MKKDIDWKRYWGPKDNIAIESEKGFLKNPETDSFINNQLVTIKDLRNHPALLLLGEPGLGKSTVVEKEVQNLKEEFADEEDVAKLIDLEAYGNEERFDKFFESSFFQEWKEGDHNLHLFIDSLDQGQRKIQSLNQIIIDRISNLPLDRLYLRLVCRSVELKQYLKKSLKEEYQEKNLLSKRHQVITDGEKENRNEKISQEGVETRSVQFHLAPLRKKDIEYAIEKSKLENELIEKLRRKSLFPLASRPMTLKFLLKTYRTNGEFPDSVNNLYREGIKNLCEEDHDSSYTASNLDDNLLPQQKLETAARIAAMTEFCQKDRFIIDQPNSFPCEEGMKVSEIIDGYPNEETKTGRSISLSKNTIQTTLSTALFKKTGDQLLSWSHKTFSEYLSAYYLSKNIDDEKILRLISYEEITGKSGVYPQIQTIVGWLSNFEPSIGNKIINLDPSVLLTSDAPLSDVNKESLINSLIKKQKSSNPLHIRQYLGNLHKLEHENLAEQIEKEINENRLSAKVLKFLIDIIRECSLKKLKTHLFETVKSSEMSLGVRVSAAHGIEALWEEGDTNFLSEVDLTSIEGDERNQILGYFLKALWPNEIELQRVFEILVKNSPESYFMGSYEGFLNHHFVNRFDKLEVKTSLEWVLNNEINYGLSGAIVRGMENKIILKGLETGYEEIITQVAHIFSKRLERNSSILGQRHKHVEKFNSMIEENNRLRQNLALKILKKLRNPADSFYDLVERKYSEKDDYLIKSDDFDQFASLLRSEEREDVQNALGRILIQLHDQSSRFESLQLVQLSFYSTYLWKNLSWTYQFIKFVSPSLFSWYQRSKRNIKRKNSETEEQREKLEPHPDKLIEGILTQIEEGNFTRWGQLPKCLAYTEYSKRIDRLTKDIDELPGWKRSTSSRQQKILDSSFRFLEKHEPEPEDWLGKDEDINRCDIEGYRAFRLIYKVDKKKLAKLTKEDWKKWSIVILGAPRFAFDREDNLRKKLIKKLYERVGQSLKSDITLIINKINQRENPMLSILNDTLQDMEGIWNEEFTRQCIELVKNTPISSQIVEDLFSFLLQNHEIASNYVLARLKKFDEISDEKKLQIAVASIPFLYFNPEQAIPVFVGKFEDSKQFKSNFINSLGASRSPVNTRNFRFAEETKLSNFYEQIERALDDQKIEGKPKDKLEDMKRGILRALEETQTKRSCTELERLHGKFGYEAIKTHLENAFDARKQNLWEPLSPESLLQFTKHPDKKIIRNGDELLELVIDTIEEIEKDLHENTSEIHRVWNRRNGDNYHPKSEDRINDTIKNELSRRLEEKEIVVNREVEVDRKSESGYGESPDIVVDAVNKKGNDTEKFRCVIEAKGCWNEELDDSIQDQLLNKYMKGNNHKYGLYLIYWCHCEEWADDDPKKNRCAEEIEDLKKEYNQKANHLSDNHFNVNSKVVDLTL